MGHKDIAPGLLCLMVALSLACSGSATTAASRRDAYALASCTDTVSCCVQRNPGIPEACGLTASEAAAYTATMDAAMRRAQDKANEEEDDGADDGWRQHCMEQYVRCRDQKKPRWIGDCYACFRYCEGQHEWPFRDCHPR
ncbi:hypothetical protein [Corallococcus macrosporus]|uniref:Lipoprotein n=1 Tax=Myxococcus fulvus (strain ATCC BAA-855 / HW-1) TaxID=483219 RepID=F8CI59_MYXFH|nr:hypothetical protein [Corallococcus macrosporus]AEI62616.1 hypothetical protein LILAB_03455 [Corallococcus macrosporus]